MEPDIRIEKGLACESPETFENVTPGEKIKKSVVSRSKKRFTRSKRNKKKPSKEMKGGGSRLQETP